jgi:TATA-box binding protein (TBP) (component of TFIID and TFIIIB)
MVVRRLAFNMASDEALLLPDEPERTVDIDRSVAVNIVRLRRTAAYTSVVAGVGAAEEEEDETVPRDFELTNYVVTFGTGCEINLLMLGFKHRGLAVTYHKHCRFPCLYFLLGGATLPPTQLRVFSSGKCLLVCARSSELALASASAACLMLTTLGVPAVLCDFRICNITASFSTGFSLDMRAYREHNEGAKFTKAFPGAVKRREADASATVLGENVSHTVFKTGGAILAGATTLEEIAEVGMRVYDLCVASRGHTAPAAADRAPSAVTLETDRRLRELEARAQTTSSHGPTARSSGTNAARDALKRAYERSDSASSGGGGDVKRLTLMNR